MSADWRYDPAAVATVTVTFNPDRGLLRAQLDALPHESLKLVVDNASQPEILRDIESLVALTPNAQLLRNDQNLGLAAAVNRGVRAVRDAASAARFVLLLDQDSEPAPGSVEALVTGFEALQASGERVGCVGPTLRDVATGLTHGFHQCTRWRWKRVYPAPGAAEPVPCANLNGSGTLVPVDLFLDLGGLEDDLFIDHVDTEWAFRVLAHGYSLFGIPQAVFRHRMGDASQRIWLFGWRVWPVRSPQRHYFLYRNAAILMRRSYVPRVWKLWATVKLCMTFIVQFFFGRERLAHAEAMWRGVKEGVRET